MTSRQIQTAYGGYTLEIERLGYSFASTGAGELPLPASSVSGARLAVMGDSRSDNGLIPQSMEVDGGRTTGVPEGVRLQGVHGWMLHALGWPMEVVGQWTLGGSKSSQCCHDHALAVIAGRKPSLVMYLGTTNDPVDYTGSGGLDSVPLGDPNADPATLPRVGPQEPVGDGIGQQGTTLGNLDKMIRYFGDLGIPVIVYEIPTENSGRRQRNIDVHQWLQARAAAGTYPNLIAPDVFTPLLSDPGNLASDVRTDLEAGVGVFDAAGDGGTFLHPSPAGARFIGETMAALPEVAAAFAGLASRVILPDGTNDAEFLTLNPAIAQGDGSGVLGYAGSSIPAPGGIVAEDWSLGHSIDDGGRSINASFDGDGNQVITISRSAGATAGLARTVQLRSAPVTITPVAGDVYIVEAEVELPARDPQDVFGVFAHIYFSETGLDDDYGQDIASGTYGSFGLQNPNHFPKDGDTLIAHGVPLEITPAMVASATGTMDLSVRFSIAIDDIADTVTNGDIVVKIKSGGIRKLTLAEAHTTAPAKPADGPAATAAPSITGSPFTGSTLTLNDATFASGSITGRRLLRDGVEVAYSGGTYDLTSADLGKRFVFENTATDGGATVVQSEVVGPVSDAPANLTALKGYLDGGENNSIADFRQAAVVSTVWTATDLSNNGNDVLQTFETRQPGIDATLGAILDGSNDCMGFTWQTAAPALSTVVMRLVKDAADAAGRLLSEGAFTYQAGFYQDADINALTGTWTVDGVSVATRDQLHDALDDGAAHTVVGTGIDTSAWAALFYSRVSGGLTGSLRCAVHIDEATADLSAARAAAVAYVEAPDA